MSSVSPELFRRCCGEFATGVAVATVPNQAGAVQGITINSFTAVSLNPPLVLFCVDLSCDILSHFRRSESWGVHFLSSQQKHIAQAFAECTDEAAHAAGWISEVLASLWCEKRKLLEAGDHAVLIGEVQRADCGYGDPLVFFRSSYRSLG